MICMFQQLFRALLLCYSACCMETKCLPPLSQDLPPYTTLVLCYSACLTLRHPITPQDIIRWATDGSLPYLNFSTISQPILDRLDPTLAPRPGVTVRLPDVMLQPKGVPGVGRLQRSAVHLAQRLGWGLPGLAVELLLLRWVQELGLDLVSFSHKVSSCQKGCA